MPGPGLVGEEGHCVESTEVHLYHLDLKQNKYLESAIQPATIKQHK